MHALTATPDAPRLARRLIEDLPGLARLPDLRFAAQLLASELVANSVRHAGVSIADTVLLALECDERMLRVEVLDRGAGFDPLLSLAEHYARGQLHRGIFLVDALADRWGFRRVDGGCVWFELDLVPGRRPWRGREPIPRRDG